jgi:hypothetical protein
MVRFNVKFSIEAPIYPVGFGTTDDMTKAKITAEFSKLTEKYNIEVCGGGPYYDEPKLIKLGDGESKVCLGKLKAVCLCSLDDFMKFYKSENPKGTPTENGHVIPFSVTLNVKRGMFGF